MPDFIDGVPKSLRAVVFALAAGGAIATGVISSLSMIESKANAAAATAVAPLQTQITQIIAGQNALWDKLGSKIDKLSDKVEELGNNVSGLTATQIAQTRAVEALAAPRHK